jgi:hypothetical protein
VFSDKNKEAKEKPAPIPSHKVKKQSKAEEPTNLQIMTS